MYSSKRLARLVGSNSYCCCSIMSSAICTSSSGVKSGKCRWCATREPMPGLERKNVSIRSL